MLRRTILAAVVALVVAAGLATAVPTPLAAASEPRYDNSIGVVRVPTQQWRPGCRGYLMRWRFEPPTDGWTVIVRIRAPRGFSVRSEFWDSGASGKRGAEQGQFRFPLCGSSVKPGRYRVEMEMIYDDPFIPGESHTAERAPTYFRLVRRR